MGRRGGKSKQSVRFTLSRRVFRLRIQFVIGVVLHSDHTVLVGLPQLEDISAVRLARRGEEIDSQPRDTLIEGFRFSSNRKDWRVVVIFRSQSVVARKGRRGEGGTAR